MTTTALHSREELLHGEWTSPRENCPKCGSHLLVNVVGVRWCSLIGCDHVGPALAAPAEAAGKIARDYLIVFGALPDGSTVEVSVADLRVMARALVGPDGDNGLRGSLRAPAVSVEGASRG